MNPLYQSWVHTLLDGPIPTETEATCQDCVMLVRGDAPGVAGFDPATKCCTFLPTLPNFLVGRMLRDTDPAFRLGRASVEARIERREGVGPLGLAVTRAFRASYRAGTFGFRADFRCPHYDTDQGNCAIWQHRNSTCSSWFCKHTRGARGYAFWSSLQRFLEAIETGLARWCLGRVPLPPAAVARVLDRKADADSDACWDIWRGREAELYRRCAVQVDDLDLQAILAITGPDARLLGEQTRAAYTRLIPADIPQHLWSMPYVVSRTTPDSVLIETYSQYDPIELPHAVLAILQQFDGRSRERIAAAIGQEIPDALIRTLLDFELLAPTPPP